MMYMIYVYILYIYVYVLNIVVWLFFKSNELVKKKLIGLKKQPNNNVFFNPMSW